MIVCMAQFECVYLKDSWMDMPDECPNILPFFMLHFHIYKMAGK